MKLIPTRRNPTSRNSSPEQQHSVNARTPRHSIPEKSAPGATAGFTDPGPTVAAMDQTSCSRFDLNILLKQLVHDFRDTIHFRVHLCSEPLPVFANIGHLSNALQALLKFLSGSAAGGETISLSSTFSNAREILDISGDAGQFLFPLSNLNVMHSSDRVFGVVDMLRGDSVLPEDEIAHFLKTARSLGSARTVDAGIQRFGRVFRKHRINLFFTSTKKTGTLIRLFISIAEVGK
jgi:hypothetical protein